MSAKGGEAEIEKEKFEYYIDVYAGAVYALCFSFVKNTFDAEDLAQETFLSAYKSFDRFDPQNPRSWLLTIAANKCRDHLKSPARKMIVADTDDLAYIEDSAPGAEQAAERSDADDRVARLCARLREPYRTPARLYYCDGWTAQEIAARTGDNPKTVATRLYRAREMLKYIVKEDEACSFSMTDT
ncbi:MAG: sigma-70 family RNA polymerase sigma factor [Oscillospiraceae bacterium]|nr:sigma-70 family RNA polymerase sigma factor [Oscillospiraceae bacterium]